MSVLRDIGDWTDQLDLPVATLEMDAAPPSLDPSRALRCPACGHVEHTDSEIPGTCVFCAGLVALEPL
jgi:hypothetical protein